MKAGETVLNWLRENAGTIAVLLVLLAVIAAIIWYLIREKRSGKGCCGGQCQGCAMHGNCSTQNNSNTRR